MTGETHRPVGHRWLVDMPPWLVVAGGATLGHVAGAVVGVVLLAGPAARLSTATALLGVHVLADTGAALGALGVRGGWGVAWWRVVGIVAAAGMVASAVALWPLGATPGWLALRAAVTVLVATVVVLRTGRR